MIRRLVHTIKEGCVVVLHSCQFRMAVVIFYISVVEILFRYSSACRLILLHLNQVLVHLGFREIKWIWKNAFERSGRRHITHVCRGNVKIF
jgi:hypothetical protein